MQNSELTPRPSNLDARASLVLSIYDQLTNARLIFIIVEKGKDSTVIMAQIREADLF